MKKFAFFLILIIFTNCSSFAGNTQEKYEKEYIKEMGEEIKDHSWQYILQNDYNTYLNDGDSALGELIKIIDNGEYKNEVEKKILIKTANGIMSYGNFNEKPTYIDVNDENYSNLDEHTRKIIALINYAANSK